MEINSKLKTKTTSTKKSLHYKIVLLINIIMNFLFFFSIELISLTLSQFFF